MKPLKGKGKEHCSMGHSLEIPIAVDWMNDVNEKRLFAHVENVKVLSLHKVGLVSKKEEPWVKDSIDFLASIHNKELSIIELWGVEIKSRQVPNTKNEELNFIQKIRRRKYELVNWSNVHKIIKDVDERWQILHHAYTYGLERVALVIGGKDGKVMSGTVVEFEGTVHESYGKILNELKNVSLHYAYDDSEPANLIIPEDILSLSDEIKTIKGRETFYGTLKLWKTLFDDPSILPRPTLKRIIPATHARWNKSKGGSDSVTKMVDNCFLKPPLCHANNETVAVARCISNMFSASHKLNQIVRSDLNRQSLPSPEHYRNNNSHRLTFEHYLLLMHQKFKSEVDTAATKNYSASRKNNKDVRARPRRATFMKTNAIPQHCDLVPQPTYQTPCRNKKKQIEEGRVPKVIKERFEKCTGHLVEMVSQDEKKDKDKFAEYRREGKKLTIDCRRECVLCGAKTKFYCLKCRSHFCFTTTKKDFCYYNEKKSVEENAREITKVFKNSCFHQKHARPALSHCQFIDEVDGNDDNDATSSSIEEIIQCKDVYTYIILLFKDFYH